uniref:Uncharacterized protein n=1 Tax=Arundo donax TaxID=35708 RepID=A0A0A9CDA0_ARUDO
MPPRWRRSPHITRGPASRPPRRWPHQ